MANLPKYTGVHIYGDRIRINYQVNGRRHYEIVNKTPTERNLKAASKLRQKRIDDLSYGVSDGPTSANSFAHYCQMYLDETVCADSTVGDYYNTLENHWMPVLGHLRIEQIKRRHIRQALRKMDCSIKTKENRLDPLSNVFKLAIEDEVIEVNPARGIELRSKAQKKKAEYEIDPILPEEWEILKQYLPATSLPYFSLIYETGMRSPHEVVALTWDDVLGDCEEISITKGIVRGKHKDSTKTGVDRTIKLSQKAQAIVRTLPSRFKRSGPLFPANHGGHLTDARSYRRHWRKAMEASGLRYRRSYNLRHSFACRSLSAGADHNWLAKYLGHSVVTLLTKYAKWLPGDKDERELSKLDAM